MDLPLIYILLSIKTRIETLSCKRLAYIQTGFISYYPLKQGLKHLALNEQVPEILDLYPTIH